MNIFLIAPTDNQITHLSEEESYHCIKVLRMRKGDAIEMVDGYGGYYKGIIEEPDARKCEVNVQKKEKEFGKRNYRLHIAIAPTKNIDRFEWFLEKATEIGVDEITPLICQRSERKDVKTERLNKVIVAAMKQSLKAYLPKLNISKSFSGLVKQNSNGQQFICTCEASSTFLLKSLYQRDKETLILIGPEGDFTQDEINLAVENSFKEVSLGENRLRTETAGIVACNTISLLNS
jgi:16S rRNA (uracil1498-N3)-methyltransferase